MNTDPPETFHLYTDLAWLWPLWGDPASGYAEYCKHVTDLIRQYARRPLQSLLDLGCGGGKNVWNLKRDFTVTGLDLSPDMLALARDLNPECEFIQGDLRSSRLNRTFDVVLMDDAIAHMNTKADFEAAFATAHAHLPSGGILIATPDVTVETFQQNKTTTSSAQCDGVEVVFIENVYDPDPTDETFETTLLYLIRRQGRLQIERDRWVLGIYSLDTWKDVLQNLGFEVHKSRFNLDGDTYTVFACIKQ